MGRVRRKERKQHVALSPQCAIINLLMVLVLLVRPPHVWVLLALVMIAYATLEVIAVRAYRRAFANGAVREARSSTDDGKVFVIVHGYPYRWFVKRYIRTRC